jgi:hypothetical protein
MSSRRHSFKYNDATRLVRAAKAAGLNVKGVTLKDGTVRVEVGDAGEQDDANTPDEELDLWRRNKRNAS